MRCRPFGRQRRQHEGERLGLHVRAGQFLTDRDWRLLRLPGSQIENVRERHMSAINDNSDEGPTSTAPSVSRGWSNPPSIPGDLYRALRNVVEWWEGLPPTLRQDIEGSGFEPGCIAAARRLSQQPQN